MIYKNPVIPGFYPDPSVCRVGEDYYLVNSSFGYFPGIPIWHSTNLIDWSPIGYCLTRENQLRLHHSAISSGGIYAPTIRHHEGRFYVVTTNVDEGGHFYVWSDDPAGEWSDPIYVDQPGIDPSLFFDNDGKVYFTSTGGIQSNGIFQCEIDILTGARINETQLIWKGTGGAFPEGPHLYKINGLYYLLCAEGGTEYGHMVTITRGKSPYGPFEPCPHNPILSHRSLHNPIHATGHADLVQTTDGSWWAVCLGIRPPSYPYRHHIGRETFLAPVRWIPDGWPIIGDNGTIALEMEASVLHPSAVEEKPEIDDFNQRKLGFTWNFIRGSYPLYSLEERPGWLALLASSVRLTDIAGIPAFIGRRQRHLRCKAAARLEFQPSEGGEEAGLTVYMNELYHCTISLTIVAGRMVVLFQRKVGSIEFSRVSAPLESPMVDFRIEATPSDYYFDYRVPGQDWIRVGQSEAHFLSTEMAGGFTGVFFGMFNVTPNPETQKIAYFDWFSYKFGE